MASSSKPSALFWVDLEANGLIPDPVDGVVNYAGLEIMEIAIIITDYELRPITGYQEAIKMNPIIAEGLRKDPDVLKMHQGSGLIKACIESTKILAEVETEIIKMLDEEVPGITLQIAGSGVAAYDQPIIKALMPRIAERLHYAPYDIGVLRRTSKSMTGRDIVNVPRSYKDGAKTHRAWDDIEAHLEEGQRFREFFQRAVQLGAHNG